MTTLNFSFKTRWLLLPLLLLTLSVGSAWGTTHTIGWGNATGSAGTYTNFTANSGTVTGVVSFSCYQNSSSNMPAYNSGDKGLRVYFNSSGNGGGITLTPASGVTISAISMVTTTTPTVKYKIGSGNLTNMSKSDKTYSATGLSVGSTSSISIQNCNTSNTQLKIQTITITYTVASACTTKPSVGANLTNVSATASSITATVPISSIGGCDITENGLVYSTSATTPTVGGTGCTKVTTDACGATAANKTITINGLSCGTTYYVRGYAINDAGTQYTTNTKTQATSACLTDHFIDEVQNTNGYTGTGMAKSGNYSNSLPSISDKAVATSGTCEQQHYHFCGWVTEANKANPKGNLATINGTATGTTYYAVWAKQGAGAGSFDGNTEGTYKIYATYSSTDYYATNTVNNNDVLTTTTTAADAQIYTFAKSGDYWTISYKSGNSTYYLTASNSVAMGAFSTTIGSYSTWRIVSQGNGLWRLWSPSTSSGNSAYAYRALMLNNSGGFKNYCPSNSYYDCKIAGTVTYTDSITECCTPLGSIKGSVSLTQTTATVTWDKLANVGTWAVTYKADGGSETSTNVTITSPDPDASHKQAVITGLIPSTHYTFYVTASNATGYCETSKTWSDVNGTTNAPYTITYKDKGNVTFSGTHASGYPTTHVYGTATTLKGATKTGYDFDGWFTAQDCSGSAITEISASQNANITLYAKWTAHQHTLTWNFNGGGTSSSSYTTGGTKDYGSAITYPADNTMSKVGYTFASWSSSATTMPDADLTITANWSPATNTAYTVKHYKQNLAGDGYDLADTDNLYGTTAANVTPDRKDYEGFSAPEGQLVTILANGSLVVEYQYTRNSYTLTWTTDGDALEGEYTGKSGKVKYGATITAPNEPTKTNFTFNGWNPAVAATMPAGDTEYTATWIANSHTVTYNANGATSGDVPVDENSPYNHGATAYALDNTGNLQKTHYTFDGWNDGTDDHGVGEDFTVNTDMILYAKWACAEYVNVSKGTPEHGTFSVSTGSKYTCDGAVDVEVTDIVPATGYQFSEVTESGKGTVDGTMVTYAQYASGASTINVTFTAKIIDVTWNLNYEGAPSSAVSKYTYDGSTVSLPSPTRTGYTLAGWFTEETGGSQITNVGGTNKPTGNVEYYAHWNVNNYSVTWMVAGDEWSGKGGQSLVAYGSHVETLPTAPNPKAEPQEGCGDKFMGWTDAAGGAYVHGTSNLYTTASQFPIAGTAGQTFYAVFADYVEK